MSKLTKTFLIIGTLVAIFLIWQLVFNDGGIIKTAYGAIEKPVNNLWGKVTGDNTAKLLPDWGGTNVTDDPGADLTW